jgi:hypothetical protein
MLLLLQIKENTILNAKAMVDKQGLDYQLSSKRYLFTFLYYI